MTQLRYQNWRFNKRDLFLVSKVFLTMIGRHFPLSTIKLPLEGEHNQTNRMNSHLRERLLCRMWLRNLTLFYVESWGYSRIIILDFKQSHKCNWTPHLNQKPEVIRFMSQLNYIPTIFPSSVSSSIHLGMLPLIWKFSQPCFNVIGHSWGGLADHSH